MQDVGELCKSHDGNVSKISQKQPNTDCEAGRQPLWNEIYSGERAAGKWKQIKYSTSPRSQLLWDATVSTNFAHLAEI